jgi:hypothetical protein
VVRLRARAGLGEGEPGEGAGLPVVARGQPHRLSSSIAYYPCALLAVSW